MCFGIFCQMDFELVLGIAQRFITACAGYLAIGYFTWVSGRVGPPTPWGTQIGGLPFSSKRQWGTGTRCFFSKFVPGFPSQAVLRKAWNKRSSGLWKTSGCSNSSCEGAGISPMVSIRGFEVGIWATTRKLCNKIKRKVLKKTRTNCVLELKFSEMLII